LRTSFITGFPQETDKDVEELVDFIKEGHLRYAGVFEYSDNKNAPSYKLPGKISEKTAKERRVIIEKAQYEIFKRDVEKMKNSEIEVLAESCKKSGGHYEIFGRAQFQAPEIDGNVSFKSAAPLEIGKFYKTVARSCKGYEIKSDLKRGL